MNPAGRRHAHALLDRVPPDRMDAAVRFLEFLLLDPVEDHAGELTPPPKP